MLRSVQELHGYTIRATDDDLGKVETFYFDDHTWTIRYLVADTGEWLPGREVLIAPDVLEPPLWRDHVFPVKLTSEQVENSPGIERETPVSRQQQIELHQYYGWPMYWGTDPYLGAAMAPPVEKTEAEAKAEEGDPYLRSTAEVIGYHIQARDGEVGHVEDFILNDEDWSLRYMVVDTRNWLPAKKVLIAPSWIEQVDWAEAKVYVDLSRESVKNSPEYDPSTPINLEYEKRLYDYYGRPMDWVET